MSGLSCGSADKCGVSARTKINDLLVETCRVPKCRRFVLVVQLAS
jgi:hypothetical protein